MFFPNDPSCIILFLPLVISILAISINSKIQDIKEKQIIESIENKVIVKRDEWKNGFEYDGKNLIPVNIFMNSDNYKNNGSFKNLNKLIVSMSTLYINLEDKKAKKGDCITTALN